MEVMSSPTLQVLSFDFYQVSYRPFNPIRSFLKLLFKMDVGSLTV